MSVGFSRGWQHRTARLAPLALLLTLASLAGAQPPASRATARAAAAVRTRLAELLTQLPQQTTVGLVVAQPDGTIWFEHQPTLALKPASVLKLFVTAAALERFGPDFTFNTRLYLRDGELLVLGGGDPGLGDERVAERHGRALHAEFDRWAAALRARGITRFRTLALDDSIFDRQHRHPDWPAAEAHKWYQAPVGGLNFNDNCLDARCAVAGNRVRLILRPELPASFVRNRLRVGSAHRPLVRRAMDQDVFEFYGPVSHDTGFPPVSAREPTLFFGYALRQALEQRGIRLKGNVVRRQLSQAALADAELLAEHVTTLPDVLWRCNTFSQNLFAECLLKALAAYEPDGRRSGQTGSWPAGVRILEDTLARLGVDLRGAVFRDGSGLSHQNRLSAAQVVQLLNIMRRHPHAEPFVTSLARPGAPGSLRHRYATAALRGRLRAKSGTLRDVRALAGYLQRPDGRELTFALLVNGRVSQRWLTQAVEALLAGEQGGS